MLLGRSPNLGLWLNSWWLLLWLRLVGRGLSSTTPGTTDRLRSTLFNDRRRGWIPSVRVVLGILRTELAIRRFLDSLSGDRILTLVSLLYIEIIVVVIS